MTFPDATRTEREQEETILLALTVLGEAEGETDMGKDAVAHVIKNRMRRKRATVGKVVLAPWQFSCWNLNEPRREFLLDTIRKGAANVPLRVWSACWRAAQGALDGLTKDPTDGATHYCTNALWGVDDEHRSRPRWHSRQEILAGRTKETAQIGGHTFGVAA